MKKFFRSIVEQGTITKTGYLIMASIISADQKETEKAAAALIEMYRAMGVTNPKQYICDGLSDIMREVWLQQ